MGLDNVGTEIYAIHVYFRGLTVSQQTPGFWGVTNVADRPNVAIITYKRRRILSQRRRKGEVEESHHEEEVEDEEPQGKRMGG